MEETLRKAGAIKHLNLASLTMTKPGTQRHGYSSRRNDDTSEEEMTQMSCGRNLREQFAATGTSSNLNLMVTSRSGAMLSNQKVPEAM